MLEELLETIEELAGENKELAYILIFLSAIVENLFPPVPGDTVLVFAAFLVGKQALDFVWVFISTTLGSIAGFMLLYYLAYRYGFGLFAKLKLKFIKESHIEKTKGWFSRYGYMVILGNRFLSGLRSVISIVGGLVKLDPIKVLVLGLISASIWNLLLLYLGYLTGENWEEIVYYVKLYSKWVFVILVMLIITIILKKYFSRKRERFEG